jgi:hypothetical protein
VLFVFKIFKMATNIKIKEIVKSSKIPWQWPPFWIFSTSQKLPHTMVDIPTKFQEVWWKESKIFFNPPLFFSMATAAKFVQPIHPHSSGMR